MKFLGWDGNRTLFSNGELGVVVDISTNLVSPVESLQELTSSADWTLQDEAPDPVAQELANAALVDLDITVLSSDRMYTIPDAVKAEAKRGLEWRKKEKRGGTSVGLNTARTLAAGGQIGIKKIRHIAKYFPRHEVDKKGKGYKPGQDGYPSNGRIAWALWGGDAAQRWASNIVERANKQKGLTAGHFAPEPRVDYRSFDNPDCQFFIRIRLDGSGIDRLYKVDETGECYVWDDGCWEDMGNVAHDFKTYDKALDEPYDTVRKMHVPVDHKTAIAVSAIFDTNPFSLITLKDLEPEETDLFQRGFPGMEWDILDQLSSEEIDEEDSWDDLGGLLAATEFETDQDGVYTSEERSEKASTQVRDALGRFATTGSNVMIGGNPDYTGTITSLNPDAGTVNVQLENGDTVEVPGSLTQEVSSFEPVSQANFPETNLDFSGILGEPRVPIDQPQAQLPGRLPPLSAADTNLLVNDWSAWVSAQRLAPEYSGLPQKPFVPKKVPDINTAMGRYYKGAFNPDGTPKAGWNPATAQNVYNEPLLRNWLDQRYAGGTGKSSYQNVGWYRPTVEDKKSREEVYSPENIQEVESRYNRALGASIVAAGEEILTPETSDVPAMYLAIVAEDDPQAVMDLVSIVPASKQTSEPISYVRKEQEWVRDDKIISDLKSATPPPVIVLSNEDLSAVVEQVDGITSVAASLFPIETALTNNAVVRALISAGGLDRNRGNAEKLRRYWTIGKGGLKIRWNTPGDWTRCNRYLRKYMGPRAKGYCALRHKEMTGVWPGSKYNVGKKKKAIRGSAGIETLKPEETIISEFTLRARAESAKAKMIGRDGVKPESYGASFIIPLVIPEELESGDGRYFNKDAIDIRNLPLPLMWQIKSGQGHDGSVVVGQITHMERTPDGIGNAYGVFDTGAYGKEAERLVRHGFLRGVSADMDKFSTDDEIINIETDASKKSKEENPDRINIKSARVMAVTIVPKPAFQECFIQVVEPKQPLQEKNMIQDGVYIEDMDAMSASAMVACGIVASSIPLSPPIEWFENPKLQKATPLTILDDGRVFGHIAAWHVDHIGMAFGTKPPRSRSNYAYFHTGILKTEEGVDMPVGQLTLAGGHAGLEASAEDAVRHYDDTASAFADVHAGEDAFGIWVAGSLRPGTTPEQIRAARASAPSGDWRPINGRLELVAVCQVNVPGFPIARARVASGQVLALVAAGAGVLAQMKSDPLAEVMQKVERLEAAQMAPLLATAEEAKARVASVQMSLLEQKKLELSSRVKEAKKKDENGWDYMIQMLDDDPEGEMAVVSRRVRERLAKEGKALPDGSFPIRNIQDLKNAVRAYGRSKPGKRAAVRKHIIRRARGLKRSDLIPNEWKRSGYSVEDGQELSLRERALAAAARLEGAELSEKDETFETVLETAEFAETDTDKDPEVEDLTPEEIQAVREEIKNKARLPERDDDGRIKYTPQTQPRDAKGKFRKVLARLKQDLGVAGLAKVVNKVEAAENLTFAGDYAKAAGAAADLIGIIERLDTKALNPEALENVRASTKELGSVIANLPFAFGQEAEKIRFSDVPPTLRDLMEEMVERVEAKIGKEDADVATADLRKFMSGGDYYNQSDISSQMSKLLRLLT